MGKVVTASTLLAISAVLMVACAQINMAQNKSESPSTNTKLLGDAASVELSEGEFALVEELKAFLKLAAAYEFSGVVLIAKRNQPIFREAYGLSDKAGNVSNYVNTKFNIDSINKMFTAVAQLAERSKLSFSDPDIKHQPDYPNKEVAAKTTIHHHLLTHTSGMGSIITPAKSEYRPDPKSRTARKIAWLIVLEERLLVDGLESGAIEWRGEPVPATMEEILNTYDRGHNEVTSRLDGLDEGAWEREVGFVVAGREVRRASGYEYAWEFLFDQVHHRGQLSTYLRPMGALVPSIYGPSGDEAS